MKRIILLNVLLISISVLAYTQNSKISSGQHIVIQTSLGDIEIVLYDDTPLHRDNMIKLIKQGFYDGQLFHRVIDDFMIQGGDPNSVNAPKGMQLGNGGPGYKIPAEFRDNHFHKKGALAAAREGDNVNPKKASSGSQFYIVKGRVIKQEELLAYQSRGIHKPFTPEQIEVYTSIGGAPHLDGSYTVFGEVIKGLNVVDKISALPKDNYNRPIQDVTYTIILKE